jgi:hypothetical protein
MYSETEVIVMARRDDRDIRMMTAIAGNVEGQRD